MFKIVEFETVVRIPPTKFNEPLEKAALEVLRETYEGQVIRDLGLVVSILEADVSNIGHIVYGDGGVYHKSRFKALIFEPMLQEVIEGEVSVVEEFGLLVRIGPVDGFVHKSQIYEDFFAYNKEQNMMLGTKTKRIVRRGDKVRARIVSVSYGSRGQSLRIGLTMRQPYLGKLEWIEEEVRESVKEEGATP